MKEGKNCESRGELMRCLPYIYLSLHEMTRHSCLGMFTHTRPHIRGKQLETENTPRGHGAPPQHDTPPIPWMRERTGSSGGVCICMSSVSQCAPPFFASSASCCMCAYSQGLHHTYITHDSRQSVSAFYAYHVCVLLSVVSRAESVV